MAGARIVLARRSDCPLKRFATARPFGQETGKQPPPTSVAGLLADSP